MGQRNTSLERVKTTKAGTSVSSLCYLPVLSLTSLSVLVWLECDLSILPWLYVAVLQKSLWYTTHVGMGMRTYPLKYSPHITLPLHLVLPQHVRCHRWTQQNGFMLDSASSFLKQLFHYLVVTTSFCSSFFLT